MTSFISSLLGFGSSEPEATKEDDVVGAGGFGSMNLRENIKGSIHGKGVDSEHLKAMVHKYGALGPVFYQVRIVVTVRFINIA